jgi:hypothetical protein
MTFYNIVDGDPAIASNAMANWRHVGRLNTDMIPFNNSGVALTDGSLNLGTSTNPWGDVNLASGKKIYIGGIEFKGGGSGSSIEAVELKSHFEKQGINYPISAPGALNESFTTTESITITPRVTYVSGTSFIFDYNKTDLDLMNATTGWTAGTNTPTIAQDTTNKIEGTGSVKMTKASLNGSIDMYKTFTAFSLIDNLLSFSFFPDTITNVTRFYVTIESSASNLKTYYVPVANITAAAWNHISIDVNNDAADATTGTLVPGSVTKIYFGYTTASSQTVNVSVDFVVYQPNWLLPVPYTSFIWDGTNQAALYVASVAGTANHQRRTYTITALANGFAVGAAYAKQRNVTISNGQGVFTSGLSGAVALTSYDITTTELPALYSAATLTMSQRFLDEEFKINALGSTTTTGLYSATDKKAYFKNGDKVIIYQKRYTGRKYTSNYNATIGYNFKILTLSADATYSGTTITLTHATVVNSGADTSYWYCVRYSAEMMYKVENMADNGALNTLTPTVFLISPVNNNTIFADYFNRANGSPANDWGITAEVATGSPTALAISSSELWIANSGGESKTRLYRNLENYSLQKIQYSGFEISLKFKWSSSNPTGNTRYVSVCLASNLATTNGNGTGFVLNYDTDVNQISTILNGTVANSVSKSFSQDTYYLVKAIIIGTRIKVKVWVASASEPISWDLDTVIAAAVGSGNYLNIFYNLMPGGGQTENVYTDDIQIKDLTTGYIVRGSVDAQSGDKLVTATKLTRQDSTNQLPIIYQRDANIA